jgi:uncharacterized protein
MGTGYKALIRETYAAFSRGDIEAVLSAMTDDVALDSPGGAPYSGRRQGRDAVRRYFAELDRYLRLDEFDMDEILEDGNRVVVLGRERATIKDTGSVFSSRFAHVYGFRKGSIAEVMIFFDTHAAASAFGESTRERQALGGPLGVTRDALSGGSRD